MGYCSITLLNNTWCSDEQKAGMAVWVHVQKLAHFQRLKKKIREVVFFINIHLYLCSPVYSELVSLEMVQRPEGEQCFSAFSVCCPVLHKLHFDSGRSELKVSVYAGWVNYCPHDNTSFMHSWCKSKEMLMIKIIQRKEFAKLQKCENEEPETSRDAK